MLLRNEVPHREQHSLHTTAGPQNLTQVDPPGDDDLMAPGERLSISRQYNSVVLGE